MKSLLFMLAACLCLTGCANFHGTNQSVWSEGAWILPLLTAIGTVIFLAMAYKGSKSGSSQQIPGRGTVYSGKNVSMFKSGFFWFGAALLIATIVIVISVVNNR